MAAGTFKVGFELNGKRGHVVFKAQRANAWAKPQFDEAQEDGYHNFVADQIVEVVDLLTAEGEPITAERFRARDLWEAEYFAILHSYAAGRKAAINPDAIAKKFEAHV